MIAGAVLGAQAGERTSEGKRPDEHRDRRSFRARSSMELLPGERKLSESSDGTVVLTSCRVRLDQGSRQFVSIPLEQVASCSIGTHSYPVLLILAAVVWLGAFQFAGERAGTIAFLIGALAGALIVLLYVVSRAQIIVIVSAGASILIRTRGMSQAACVQFVDDLERARLALQTRPLG